MSLPDTLRLPPASTSEPFTVTVWPPCRFALPPALILDPTLVELLFVLVTDELSSPTLDPLDVKFPLDSVRVVTVFSSCRSTTFTLPPARTSALPPALTWLPPIVVSPPVLMVRLLPAFTTEPICLVSCVLVLVELLPPVNTVPLEELAVEV